MLAAVIIGYLVVGAGIGTAFVFLIENWCPSNGEVLKAVFFGALVGVPGAALTVICFPLWGSAMLCEHVAESPRWAAFRRWCARPVCAKPKSYR